MAASFMFRPRLYFSELQKNDLLLKITSQHLTKMLSYLCCLFCILLSPWEVDLHGLHQWAPCPTALSQSGIRVFTPLAPP